MTRTTFVLTTAFSALLLAQSAAAQPRWGRERVPQTGACFYEDANFNGDYFCLRSNDRLASMPRGMGDRISSVRLVGATQVTVFRDSNLSGRSARFITDIADLRGEGWNDQISSINVTRSRGYDDWFPAGDDRARNRDRNDASVWDSNGRPVWGRNQQVPREGACFYEDANFRGDYFCLPRGATYTALPRGFNDRISSVRVMRSEVRLFQDEDFRGRTRQVRGNVRNLRDAWGDRVSSIRVF